ncbi:alpha-hydroxy-acid oxidizing protein [Halobacillus trueperi]|uniref:FMN-dependent dehydrogenase domain-containing protein n=1 Tax=Halobacillus trueperi TaxID=156205 RepID=A0A3E0JDL3_9BACI|nr:alpha-hydroxy-acid oxidizing protein [Halobacillus trueperi]REJ11028.1 hypothetical protein DYE48_01110 [Halobacillus trueperi]
MKIIKKSRYSLAVAGEQGVHEAFINLLADTEITMALSGCPTIVELNRSILIEFKG